MYPLRDRENLTNARTWNSVRWSQLRKCVNRLWGSALVDPNTELTCIDVGCGSGEHLAGLRRLFRGGVVGVDDWRGSQDGVPVVRHGTEAVKILGRRADCIVTMDVIEHVPEEKWFLDELSGWLEPMGALVVSAPLHPVLFGPHDVHVGHYRRYRLAGLAQTVLESGYRVEWSGSTLTGLALAARLWPGKRTGRLQMLDRFPVSAAVMADEFIFGRLPGWRYGLTGWVCGRRLTGVGTSEQPGSRAEAAAPAAEVGRGASAS